MGGGYRTAMLAGVVASLCMSCADPPWRWQGTTDFTASEREQIDEGQAFICAKTNRECEPVAWTRSPGDTRSYSIVRMTPVRDPQVFGVEDSKTGQILIMPGTPIRRVAAHEFGHWSNMSDLDAGLGLMSHAIPSNELEWTDADEAECRRVTCRLD